MQYYLRNVIRLSANFSDLIIWRRPENNTFQRENGGKGLGNRLLNLASQIPLQGLHVKLLNYAHLFWFTEVPKHTANQNIVKTKILERTSPKIPPPHTHTHNFIFLTNTYSRGTDCTYLLDMELAKNSAPFLETCRRCVLSFRGLPQTQTPDHSRLQMKERRENPVGLTLPPSKEQPPHGGPYLTSTS